jgi:hypothetical protein
LSSVVALADRGNAAAGGSGYNCFVIPSEAEQSLIFLHGMKELLATK